MPPMEEPMPPMDDQQPPMEEPMGGEEIPPMDGGEMGQDGDDAELMDTINGLSVEDKAAVLKYAKSMADDSNNEQEEMPPMDNGQDMPMESKRSFDNIIDEVINDYCDDNNLKRTTKRPNKDMPKEYEGITNPFKAPY